jgi:outer membrane protein OmpA-like peptidoglycan-associated protein
MAYSENRPGKNNWLIGLIILIILALLAFYFLRGRNNSEVVAEAASDSSTVESTINANWSGVDPVTLPLENYEELQDSDITVRGSDQYAIYSLGEAVLFDSGKSALKSGAETKLEKILKSAVKRYPDADIRIYGHTDASGDKASNKKLAEERGEAVKSWIVQNGNVKAEHISVNPIGESDPVASNASEAGRAENRRVEIAVRKKK